MNTKVITFAQKFMKKNLPVFEVGDTVDVVVKFQEGEKDRKQTFQGTVISFSGEGINRTFTVRRIVQGEGVERVFPLHSPGVVTVRVVRKGKVRRAKLYYLRDRVGKATKVKEKIWGLKDAQASAAASEKAEQEMMANFRHEEKKDKKGRK